MIIKNNIVLPVVVIAIIIILISLFYFFYLPNISQQDFQEIPKKDIQLANLMLITGYENDAQYFSYHKCIKLAEQAEKQCNALNGEFTRYSLCVDRGVTSENYADLFPVVDCHYKAGCFSKQELREGSHSRDFNYYEKPIAEIVNNPYPRYEACNDILADFFPFRKPIIEYFYTDEPESTYLELYEIQLRQATDKFWQNKDYSGIAQKLSKIRVHYTLEFYQGELFRAFKAVEEKQVLNDQDMQEIKSIYEQLIKNINYLKNK